MFNRSNFASLFARVRTGVLVAGLATTMIASVQADRAIRVSGALWADGELYDTILTDTVFKTPPAQSLDRLFNFAGSGLDGQRSIAEAAPGDADYNGGRWSVMLVVFTEEGLVVLDEDGDGSIDVELTSEEDVMLAHEMGLVSITSAGVYFECPLLRHR